MGQKYVQSGALDARGTGSIRIFLHYPFKPGAIIWAASDDPEVKTTTIYENDRHFLINYSGPDRTYRIRWAANGYLD